MMSTMRLNFTAAILSYEPKDIKLTYRLADLYFEYKGLFKGKSVF